MTNLTLPTYIQDSDQENYNVELNETLREFIDDNWWLPQGLTAAQVVTLTNNFPTGAFWFNIDIAKMQVCTAPGVIETITSA
jgi:hypothetical protein